MPAKDQRKYPPEQVAEALRETHGLVTLAGRKLGADLKTMQRMIRENASVRAVIDECDERICDLAEGKLVQAITAGDPWAIQFFLRTRGRKRGYSERIDIEEALREIAREQGLDETRCVQNGRDDLAAIRKRKHAATG